MDRVAFGPEFGHEYRVIFWHEGQRRNEWVYERELQDVDAQREYIMPLCRSESGRLGVAIQ